MRFFFIFLISFSFCSSQELFFTKILIENGFENVSSIQKDGDLYLSYENNVYRFEAKALAFILILISEYEFKEYENIHFLIRTNDIPMAVASLSTADLYYYRNGFIDRYAFVSKMAFSFNTDKVDSYFEDAVKGNSSFYKIDVPVGLEMDYALGDFDDGLKTRIYINPRALSTFGKGIGVEFKFQNIIQNDLPGRAFSSPIIFKFNQSLRFGNNSFLSASLGYLPQSKFGLHTRFRNYLDNERFYIEFFYGITRLGYLTEKWVPESNRNTDATFQAIMNYRWNKFDTDINLTYGTFYAGDLGYKLQFTRQFNEVYFNLFYARTDVASSGSFGSQEEGIVGFSLTVPFGQSKFMKPTKFRARTEDQFDLLYRYSGFSLSGIDIIQGANIFSEIREFYPEVLKKGLLKHLR